MIKEVELVYVWYHLKIEEYRLTNQDVNLVAARDVPKVNPFLRKREVAHQWNNLR